MNKLMLASGVFTLMLISPLHAEAAATAPTAPATDTGAASSETGDRIERHLDRKGDRIDRRLDRRGEYIDQRLDRRGERLHDRARDTN